MEIVKNEIAAVVEVLQQAQEIIELKQLELLMVGGGTGDVHFG